MSIYCKDQTLFASTGSAGSQVWKAILWAKNKLCNGYELRLGDGSSNLWFDKWLGGSLLCHALPFVDTADIHIQLKDVWHDGRADLQIIRTILPTDLRNQLSGLNLFFHHHALDVMVWRGNSDEIYTVKSGYD